MRATIAAFAASFVMPALACQPCQNFKMTFYGWPDNSPPGNKVAMNCGGRKGVAAGTGTYEDPLTMAAEQGRFADCEIVYSPYLRKYLRMEDTCANCSGDWVDIWTGSTTSDPGSGVKACQNTLTGKDSANQVIIQTPPNNLAVNSGELYAGGQCLTQNVYPADAGSTSCSAGSTTGGTYAPASSAAAAAAAPATSSTSYHTYSASTSEGDESDADVPSAPSSAPKTPDDYTPDEDTPDEDDDTSDSPEDDDEDSSSSGEEEKKGKGHHWKHSHSHRRRWQRI